MRKLALMVAAALTLAAEPPDCFERAVAALGQGQSGESLGDRAAMLAAARALNASGAAPVDPRDDAVARWQQLTRGSLGEVSRNRTLGPGYRLLLLQPGAGATFEQTFYGGQRARVAVAPAPAASFELQVTEDGAGAPVCAATPARTLCDWVPLYTARFRIAIVNQGANSKHFYLVVE